MKGSEFFKRVQRFARKKNLRCDLDLRHGKGSHARLYVGDRFTTLKDRKKEIGLGLLKSMCEDLGIDPREI